MDCNMPGLPIHNQLLEFTQTHLHWVGDAIQLSHPLSLPSPPVFNLCQHQGLFKWVSSSHQVAKVLEFQLQHQSFQWTPRTDLLQNGLVGSPCSPRDSQESSTTPQFKSINSSGLSHLQTRTVLLFLFQFEFILFLFLSWLPCLGVPKLCWIVVVKVNTFILFPILNEMLSAFYHWGWCLLCVSYIWPLFCWSSFPICPLSQEFLS